MIAYSRHHKINFKLLHFIKIAIINPTQSLLQSPQLTVYLEASLLANGKKMNSINTKQTKNAFLFSSKSKIQISYFLIYKNQKNKKPYAITNPVDPFSVKAMISTYLINATNDFAGLI